MWLHNSYKYTNNPNAEFIETEVPDIDALKEEARRLLGTPYGYTDCLRIGIYEILHIEIPDNAYVLDCSENQPLKLGL